MAKTMIRNVRLAGIAAALPEAVRTVEDEAKLFGADEMAKTAKSIGVRQRHIAPPGICTSDLCHLAADRLLDDLGWTRDSVEGLIFVSQSPDYELPSTACTLQARLALGTDCAAFDVGLGCSGFVYGLWLAAQLAACGTKRIVLLAGDVSTRRQAPRDKAVIPLFGDAGTATAIEFAAGAPEMAFEMGTDGTGYRSIIIPASGFREPRTERTKQPVAGPDGIERTPEHIYINGADVFNFTIKRVPPLVERVIEQSGIAKESHDYFVFHQANAFMLQHLGKRLKLPPEKFVIAMEEVGNTSSASIPLAMTMSLAEKLTAAPRRLLLAGFGVGLSWGAVSLEAGPMVIRPPYILSGAIEQAA
jgi:3-oxoacyl-[acyl-carrier-protein] synthase-3